MKKTISFTKEIKFPSMIGEVTSISLEHNLVFIDESNVEGNFKVSGTYKLTEASRLEENFSYDLPAEIILSERLDLNTTKITIENFTYEIEEDTLICKIDVNVEGVEVIDVDDPKIEPVVPKRCIEEDDVLPTKEVVEEEKEVVEEKPKSLFSNLGDEETFSTYSIYVLQEEETISSIMEKYHVSKEDLENYNDLSNLSTGSKIIVPNTDE